MSLFGRIVNTVRNDVFHPIGRVFTNGGPQQVAQSQPQRPSQPMVDPRALQAAMQMGFQNPQRFAINQTHYQPTVAPPPPPPRINLQQLQDQLRQHQINQNQFLQAFHNLPGNNIGSRYSIGNIAGAAAHAVPTVARETAQAIPHGIAQLGVSAAQAVGLPAKTTPNKVGKFLMGDQPIVSIQNQFKADKAKHGLIPAIGLAGLTTATDAPFFPGGAGAKTLSALAKTTDVAGATKLLVKAGIHPDVIKLAAPSIAKATKPAEVQGILQATHEAAGVPVPKKFAPIVNKPNVPPDVQEVINAANQHLNNGNLDEARALAESLPQQHANPILQAADNAQKQYEDSVLQEVTGGLKPQEGSDAAVMSDVAKKLSAHLNAPKALYKFTGAKRTYRTPLGDLAVGGDAKTALDHVFFGGDLPTFNRNIDILAHKFGGTFGEISNMLKANAPDGADYERFTNELQDQLSKRPSYSRRSSEVTQNSPIQAVQSAEPSFSLENANAPKSLVTQPTQGAVGAAKVGIKAPGLTKTELTAGKALGMSLKDIKTAKSTNDLNKALQHSVDQIQAGQHYGIGNMAELSSKEQQAVTNVLKNHPSPTRAIPKAPIVGDLPAMAELPSKNKLLSNKVNAIRAINTPSAHALADTIQNVEKDSTGLRANWMYRLPTVQKLGNKDFQRAWDIQEGAKVTKADSPAVKQAAQELQGVMKDVHSTGFNEGILSGHQNNYMPHRYPENFFTKTKGSAYDSAIQHLINTKQIDHAQATQLFKDTGESLARAPKHFGHFEYSRLTDIPGYTKNKQTLYDYLQGAADSVARARHFGNDNEVANGLLDRIRMEGGDSATATKALGNYIRSADRGIGAGTARGIRGFFGAARLGKAAISHAGQTSNVAVDTRLSDAATGWGKWLSRNKSDKDFIAKTGLTNPQALHAYQDQFTSVRGAMSKITAPVLNPTMSMNRGVSALAYQRYGNFLASKGNVGELRKLGVEGDIGKTLTPEQEIQAARGGVNRTMFSGSRATTPIYAETPAGKTIGQYRTAFMYKQTGFIYDRILKEAKNGNIKPLLKYLGISAGVTGATYGIKNKLSGSKEGPGGIALDTLGALGGIPGEMLVQGARYGKKDLTKTAAGDIAPALGEGVDLLGRAQGAIKGKYGGHDYKGLEGYAAGLVPFAGSRLSKAVYENKPPKGSTAQGTPDTPAGIRQAAMSGASVNINGKPTPWNSLTEAQRKTAAGSDPVAKAFYEKEQAMKTGLSKPGVYPDGVSPESAHTLDIRNRLTTKGWNALVNSHNDAEYMLNQATYEKNKAEGKLNAAQDVKAQSALAKDKVGADYTKNVRDLYTLSKAKIYQYITSAPDGKALADQLNNYDLALKDAGLITTAKFKTGFAPKVATGSSRSTGVRGTRSSGAKIATLKVKLPPKPKKVSIGKLPSATSAKAKTGFKTPKLATKKPKKIKFTA